MQIHHRPIAERIDWLLDLARRHTAEFRSPEAWRARARFPGRPPPPQGAQMPGMAPQNNRGHPPPAPPFSGLLFVARPHPAVCRGPGAGGAW